MANTAPAKLRRLPSVDEVVRSAGAMAAIARFGRPAVVAAVRRVLAEFRDRKAVASQPAT